MERYTTYAVFGIVDFRDGKNREKAYGTDFPLLFETRDKAVFDKWLAENHPTAFEMPFGGERHKAYPNYPNDPHLHVVISNSHALHNQPGSWQTSYGFTEFETKKA